MTYRLNHEIKKLHNLLLDLAAKVESAMTRAIESLLKLDATIAKAVIEGDRIIDQLEVEVEEECLKILALHQPVATDLRHLVAIIKINNELERIGDLSANIARRVLNILEELPCCTVELHGLPAVRRFEKMSTEVRQMLFDALDSFIRSDAEMAQGVLDEDNRIDEVNRQNFKSIEQSIRENPQDVGVLLPVLSVSKQFERIGDCTENIAEDVLYWINGQIFRHVNS